MPPTPRIQAITRETKARWPSLTYGFYNPRHIGSNPSKPWSQHAGSEPEKGWYGNAADIHDPDDDYLSPTLDQVYAFLDKNRDRFNIKTLLWRIEAHYDHIHVDCWPKMKDNWWYTPPAKGGKLVTVNEDGTTQATFATEGPDEDMETLQLGDQGNTVVKLQKALNGWVAKFATAKTPLGEDGDFGPSTDTRVKEYQAGANLPRYTPGIVGGITWGSLMEYVPDWIDNHTETTSGIQSGDQVTFTGTINETE